MKRCADRLQITYVVYIKKKQLWLNDQSTQRPLKLYTSHFPFLSLLMFSPLMLAPSYPFIFSFCLYIKFYNAEEARKYTAK